MLSEMKHSQPLQVRAEIAAESSGGVLSALIINADDWGRDAATTDRILECWSMGTVSSASAMVFMEDSERSSEIAKARQVDCGLHLNFTTSFSSSETPARLREHQERITRYLRRNKFAKTVFHPGLASSFEYVTLAQVDEFAKRFGGIPCRYDGHHHMHLCANVLFGKLIPGGSIVRRNFRSGLRRRSINRLYRQLIDRGLAKKYRITDYFFSLPPLEPRSRVDEIISVSQRSIVELETHPINPVEYRFLMDELSRNKGEFSISRAYSRSVEAA